MASSGGEESYWAEWLADSDETDSVEEDAFTQSLPAPHPLPLSSRQSRNPRTNSVSVPGLQSGVTPAQLQAATHLDFSSTEAHSVLLTRDLTSSGLSNVATNEDSEEFPVLEDFNEATEDRDTSVNVNGDSYRRSSRTWRSLHRHNEEWRRRRRRAANTHDVDEDLPRTQNSADSTPNPKENCFDETGDASSGKFQPGPIGVFFRSMMQGEVSAAEIQRLVDLTSTTNDPEAVVFCNLSKTEGFALVGHTRQAEEIVELVYQNHVICETSHIFAEKCPRNDWIYFVETNNIDDMSEQSHAVILEQVGLKTISDDRPTPTITESAGEPQILSTAEPIVTLLQFLLELISNECTGHTPSMGGYTSYLQPVNTLCWKMHGSRSPYHDRTTARVDLPQLLDTRSSTSPVAIPEFSQRPVFTASVMRDNSHEMPSPHEASLRETTEQAMLQCNFREPTMSIRLVDFVKHLELRTAIASHCLSSITRPPGRLADVQHRQENNLTTKLQFASETGQFLRFNEERTEAIALAHGDGLCWTESPLQSTQALSSGLYKFELVILSVPASRDIGFLSVGVFTSANSQSGPFAPNSYSWMVSGNEMVKDVVTDTSRTNVTEVGLNDLRDGDTLCVQVSDTGILTMQRNTQDLGVAISGIPIDGPLYALVDLYTAGTSVCLKGRKSSVSPSSTSGYLSRRPFCGTLQYESQNKHSAALTWITGFAATITASKSYQNATLQMLDGLLEALLTVHPLSLQHSGYAYTPSARQIASFLDELDGHSQANGSSDAVIKLSLELRIALAVATGEITDLVSSMEALQRSLEGSSKYGRLRVPKALHQLTVQLKGIPSRVFQSLPPESQFAIGMSPRAALAVILGWIHESATNCMFMQNRNQLVVPVRAPVTATFCRFSSTIRCHLHSNSIEKTRNGSDSESSSAQLDIPISVDAPYFEIKFKKCGASNPSGISVGLAPAQTSNDVQPTRPVKYCVDTDTIETHGQSVKLFFDTIPEVPTDYTTVGCGLFINSVGIWSGAVYFTVNGIVVGCTWMKSAETRAPLHPTVYLALVNSCSATMWTRCPPAYSMVVLPPSPSADPIRLPSPISESQESFHRLWMYCKSSFSQHSSQQEVEDSVQCLKRITLLLMVNCSLNCKSLSSFNESFCDGLFHLLLTEIDSYTTFDENQAFSPEIWNNIKNIVKLHTKDVDDEAVDPYPSQRAGAHRNLDINHHMSQSKVDVAVSLLASHINIFFASPIVRRCELQSIFEMKLDENKLSRSRIILSKALMSAVLEDLSASGFTESDLLDMFSLSVSACIRFGKSNSLIASRYSLEFVNNIVRFAAVLQEHIIGCIAVVSGGDISCSKDTAHTNTTDTYMTILLQGLNEAMHVVDYTENVHLIPLFKVVVADFVQWSTALPTATLCRKSVYEALSACSHGIARHFHLPTQNAERAGRTKASQYMSSAELTVEVDGSSQILAEWWMSSSRDGNLAASNSQQMLFDRPGATSFEVWLDPRTDLESHLASERFVLCDAHGNIVKSIKSSTLASESDSVTGYRVFVEVSDVLHITFTSASTRQHWGWRMRVRALGRRKPELHWMYDLLLSSSAALGRVSGSVLFNDTNDSETEGVVSINERINGATWRLLISNGLKAETDCVIATSRSDTANCTPTSYSPVHFEVAGKSEEGDVISKLCNLAITFANSAGSVATSASGDAWPAFSAARKPLRVPSVGGAYVNSAVSGAAAAALYHSVANPDQDTITESHCTCAIRICERLRPWLIKCKQEMAVQTDLNDTIFSQSKLFNECYHRIAFLLSLRPQITGQRSTTIYSIEQTASMVVAFIMDQSIPADATASIRGEMRKRDRIAQDKIDVLGHLHKLVVELSPFSIPATIALREVARWRFQQDGSLHAKAQHILADCYGCNGQFACTLREGFCTLVVDAVECVFDSLNDESATPTSADFGAMAHHWTILGILLQLLNLSWSESDYECLRAHQVQSLLFSLAMAASDKFAQLGDSSVNVSEVHVEFSTLLQSVSFRAWQHFSDLTLLLTDHASAPVQPIANLALQDALATIIDATSTENAISHPDMFLRVTALLSQLCSRSQMAVATSLASMSHLLVKPLKSSPASVDNIYAAPPTLYQLCLKTFLLGVSSLKPSFLVCVGTTKIIERLRNSPFWTMAQTPVGSHHSDPWSTLPPNRFESNTTPDTSMEWGAVATRAAVLLLQIGTEATANENCRIAIAASAALRSLCATSSVAPFLAPVLRSTVKTCFHTLRQEKQWMQFPRLENSISPRVQFVVYLISSAPKLLCPGTRFRSAEEDDTIYSLVHFNPFTLSCTLYGPQQDVVAKPAVVLEVVESSPGHRSIETTADLKDVLDLTVMSLNRVHAPQSSRFSANSAFILKVLRGYVGGGGSSTVVDLLDHQELMSLLFNAAGKSTGQHLDLLVEDMEMLWALVGAVDIKSEFNEVYSTEPRPYKNCSKKFLLRVRVDPDLMADVIGLVEPGEEVMVVGHVGNWCKLQRKPSWKGSDPFAWAMHVATDADQVRHLMLEPLGAPSLSRTSTMFSSSTSTTADTEPVAQRLLGTERRRMRRASLPERLDLGVNFSPGNIRTRVNLQARSATSTNVSRLRRSLTRAAPRRLVGRHLSESGTDLQSNQGSESNSSASDMMLDGSAVSVHTCSRRVESPHPVPASAIISGSETIPGAAALLVQFAPECHKKNPCIREQRSFAQDPVAGFLQQSVADAFGPLLDAAGVEANFSGTLQDQYANDDASSGGSSPERPTLKVHTPSSPGKAFKSYPGVELLLGSSDTEITHTVRGQTQWPSVIVNGDTVTWLFRTPKHLDAWGFKFRISIHRGKPFSTYDEGFTGIIAQSDAMQKLDRSKFEVPPPRSLWSFKPTLATAVEVDSDASSDVDDSRDWTSWSRSASPTRQPEDFSGNTDSESTCQEAATSVDLPLNEVISGVEPGFDMERDERVLRHGRVHQAASSGSTRDISAVLLKSTLGKFKLLDNEFRLDIGHATAVLQARAVLVLILANWPQDYQMELVHVGGSPAFLFWLLQLESQERPTVVKSAMTCIVRFASRDLLNALLAHAADCVAESGTVTVRKCGPSTYRQGDAFYRDQVWIRGAKKLTVHFDPSTFRVCHADELTFSTNWNFDGPGTKTYTSFGTPSSPVTIPGDRLYIQYRSPVALTEAQPWSFTVTGTGVGQSNVGLALLSTYIRSVSRSTPDPGPDSTAGPVPAHPVDNSLSWNHFESMGLPPRAQSDSPNAGFLKSRSTSLWQSEMLLLLWRTLTGLVSQLHGRALLDCIRLLTDLLGTASPESAFNLKLLLPLAKLFRKVSNASSSLEASAFLRTLSRLFFVAEDRALQTGLRDQITEVWERSREMGSGRERPIVSPSVARDGRSAWGDIDMN